MRSVRSGMTIAAAVQAAMLAVMAVAGVQADGIAVGALFCLVGNVLIATGLSRSGAGRIGAANTVTLLRFMLVAAVAALVSGGIEHRAALVAIAAIALLLDGVDGKVARATGTASEFGASFDMETDAALVLILSVAAASAVGPWVVLLGAARYLLLVASRLVPRLAAPTAPRFWRKIVAAAQGIVLALLCTGWLPTPIAEAVAVAAALALAWSFGTQIFGLLRTPTPVERQLDAALQ